MTDVRVTQAAVEEWASPNPNAQVTQVALEEWGTVTTQPGVIRVTQAAVEEWASVRVVQTARQYAVTVNTG